MRLAPAAEDALDRGRRDTCVESRIAANPAGPPPASRAKRSLHPQSPSRVEREVRLEPAERGDDEVLQRQRIAVRSRDHDVVKARIYWKLGVGMTSPVA